MHRIHIVGSSPRSGTTLLAEMMANCFRVHAEPKEAPIYNRPTVPVDVYVTKRPQDVLVSRFALRALPNLDVLCMVRDPRDVVVSVHREDPDRYWASLKFWKTWEPVVQRLQGRERFTIVRYEDLVRDPDGEQRKLMMRLPYLEEQSRSAPSMQRLARQSSPSMHWGDSDRCRREHRVVASSSAAHRRTTRGTWFDLRQSRTARLRTRLVVGSGTRRRGARRATEPLGRAPRPESSGRASLQGDAADRAARDRRAAATISSTEPTRDLAARRSPAAARAVRQRSLLPAEPAGGGERRGDRPRDEHDELADRERRAAAEHRPHRLRQRGRRAAAWRTPRPRRAAWRAGRPSRRGTAARGTARWRAARFASARSVPAMSMPMPGERDGADEQQRRPRRRGRRSTFQPSAMPVDDDRRSPG